MPLTNKEADQLMTKGEALIKRYIAARADGRISPRERRKLVRQTISYLLDAIWDMVD